MPPAKNGNSTSCPVCKARCKTVKSIQITDEYREITYLCTNFECRHIFVASLVPIRTLSKSELTDREPIPATG